MPQPGQISEEPRKFCVKPLKRSVVVEPAGMFTLTGCFCGWKQMVNVSSYLPVQGVKIGMVPPVKSVPDVHPTQRGSKLKLAGLITRSEESRGEIEHKFDVQGWNGMGGKFNDANR